MPMIPVTRPQIRRIATATATAHSRPRYRSWDALGAALLRFGYSEAETVAILCSKWTRYAADASDASYGRATAKDLMRWMKSGTFGRPILQKDLDRLMAEYQR